MRAWGWATDPYTMPDGEPSADIGSFQAPATPRGDAVTFAADGCTIVARLVEGDLTVDRDIGCLVPGNALVKKAQELGPEVSWNQVRSRQEPRQV